MDDAYILHTHPNWLSYHSSHHVGQLVAFMRGPMGSLVRFSGGELLVFLMGDVNPHEVGGIATFVSNQVDTLENAWQRYKDVLGASTKDEFYRLAPIENPTDNSETAILEAENFRPIDPPIRLTDLGVTDRQGATRGWYLSTAETETLLDRLGETRAEQAQLGAEEGGRLLQRHLRIERNQYLVALAKKEWAHKDPDLRCEVCRFSFSRRYREIGRDFVEAHHRKPLKELEHGVKVVTRVSDLAPVCSNCHRMLHTKGGRSIDDVRTILGKDDGANA